MLPTDNGRQRYRRNRPPRFQSRPPNIWGNVQERLALTNSAGPPPAWVSGTKAASASPRWGRFPLGTHECQFEQISKLGHSGILFRTLRVKYGQYRTTGTGRNRHQQFQNRPLLTRSSRGI